MIRKTVKQHHNENSAIVILLVFLSILSLAFVGWFSYLCFLRPAYKPMAATTEYNLVAGATYTESEYRNLEIGKNLSVTGQRSEFQVFDSAFSAHTEYHYEVMITSDNTAYDYFTIDRLTIRLSYGNTITDAEGTSSFREIGYYDFTFESGDTEYTTAYLSIDADEDGNPITEVRGDTTNFTIGADSVVKAYKIA